MFQRLNISLALIAALLLAIPPIVLEARAIAAASLASAADTSGTVGGTVFTTASFTPTANALVIGCVLNSHASAAEEPVSVVGNGGTWVKITTQLGDASTWRLTSYRYMQASPSTGTLVFTYTGAQTGAAWKIHEFTGVDTSGTNGSGALVQFADDVIGTGNTTLTVTLGAFGDATNNVGDAC